MRNALIDTNVYAAFKKGEKGIVEAFRHLDFIGLDVTVAGELLAGFTNGSRERKNREELDAFLGSPRVHFLPHDLETADFYSRVYASLKKKGKPIPTNDLWIAAQALRYGLELWSLDRHFSSVEGLAVRNDF